MNPMNRREALQRMIGAAALPLLGSCGVDRLLSSSLALSSTDGAIRLIGGGDPHMSPPTNWPQWRITDHIKAALDLDPAAYAFCLGDLTPGGSAQELRDYYDLSWGRFKARTFPAFGNHDMIASTIGTPYYDYWDGLDVGARGKGYYHKLLGEHWLLVVLNSQQVRSEQTAWLKALLPLHPTRHIIAMCHFPFLTSPCLHNNVPSQMDWPGDAGIGQFVKVLEAYGCEIYAAGHCHTYSRTPRVVRNPYDLHKPIVSEKGMRQFVLGTAGVKPMVLTSLYPVLDGSKTPGAKTIQGLRGVFEFALYPDRYEWKLNEVVSKLELGAVRDSGMQMCRVVTG